MSLCAALIAAHRCVDVDALMTTLSFVPKLET